MKAKKQDSNRGLMTSELWLNVAGGGGVYQLAMIEGGPTMEQAICACALAVVCVAYAVSRTRAKQAPPSG